MRVVFHFVLNCDRAEIFNPEFHYRLPQNKSHPDLVTFSLVIFLNVFI